MQRKVVASTCQCNMTLPKRQVHGTSWTCLCLRASPGTPHTVYSFILSPSSVTKCSYRCALDMQVHSGQPGRDVAIAALQEMNAGDQ